MKPVCQRSNDDTDELLVSRFLPEDAWINMTRSRSRTFYAKVLATDIEVESR